MPHMTNTEYVKNVGMDKPTHDVTEVYDSYYGTYKEQPIYVNGAVPQNFQIQPFRLT